MPLLKYTSLAETDPIIVLISDPHQQTQWSACQRPQTRCLPCSLYRTNSLLSFFTTKGDSGGVFKLSLRTKYPSSFQSYRFLEDATPIA